MRVPSRSLAVLALAAATAAYGATAALYDDAVVFVDGTADDVAFGGSGTATLDLWGTSTQGVDVIFVVDGSGSLGASGWTTVKATVTSAVTSLSDDIDSGDLRVGVVVFATGATTAYTFDDTQDAATINAAVSALSYPTGQTYTRDGMDQAISDFEAYGDTDRAWRVVMLTDGNPNPSTTQNPCLMTCPPLHMTNCDRAKATRLALATYDIDVGILGAGTAFTATTLECLVDDADTDIVLVDADYSDADAAAMIAPPAVGEGATLTLAIGDDFAIDDVTSSTGTASVSGSDITWTVGTVDEDGATLTIAYTHTSDTFGPLDLITGGTLGYTDAADDAAGADVGALTIEVGTNDVDGDGSTLDVDCDDADAARHPGATERCADLGVDNDCDGDTTDADDEPTWYGDADGDGRGDPADSSNACAAPDGYLADADDACPLEDASGFDANGDGCIDDADGDGAPADVDCDDGDATSYPGAPEACADVGIDNDCDADDTDADDPSSWYADTDGDGRGDPADMLDACDAPAGYVADAADACPLEDASGFDDDGDGCIDDADGDGAPADLDCDDGDATSYPGAAETCDDAGIDNDCDGDTTDADDKATWYADADGDSLGDPSATLAACDAPAGYVAVAGDVCPSENATGSDTNADGCIDASTGCVDTHDKGRGKGHTKAVGKGHCKG